MRSVLIEDELIIAMDLELRLSSFDIEVLETASDYESALKAVKIHSPELIFMDINIKGEKTGLDIAKQLRFLNINTTIIFLTAFSNPNTLTTIESISNSFYLKKPFNEKHLKEMIDQVR